jgi:tetratricopeptide (TPR) repeat protein
MVDLARLDNDSFLALCREILAGLGMSAAQEFPAQGVERAFRLALVRESTDKMFRTEEKWLCIFARSRSSLQARRVQPFAQAAIAAGAGYLLLVAFCGVDAEAKDLLRGTLAKEGIRVALLEGALAEALAMDYGRAFRPQAAPGGFSFSRLREQARNLLAAAPWHKRFQTPSIQPMRLLPLNPQDAALSEADLFRVLQGDSFLLLGDPGAGKTTSLQALAGALAKYGALTPVFLPLGRYQGDFWAILCEALAPGASPVSKATALGLVESGALVLMLDGINEVQNPDLQERLVGELNRLTNPSDPAAHSRWIVSGRVHDYRQGPNQLSYLEARRWEVQPFTEDLVFRFLANELGEAPGLALYHQLGQAVREICANPLLLNMLLEVHRETGHVPASRSALYRQFVELMLRWGSERELGAAEQERLNALFAGKLTEATYQSLVMESLTALAVAMPTTMIQWSEACKQFEQKLTKSTNPTQAAALLLEDLSRRGILRRDSFNRVSFFHHTFQEYFLARQLAGRPVNELIPSGGVLASQREAVVFAASLHPNPAPLIKRAINVDLQLAFEMVRDTPKTIPSVLIHQLAQRLWGFVVAADGAAIGYRRRQAILFRQLADLEGKTAESLAAEVDAGLDQIKQTERVMTFYAHLGDAKSQQQALAQVATGEDVPEGLLFHAAWAARSANDHQRAIDLFTRHLEKNPESASAFNNRAISHKSLGHQKEALVDYERAVELDGSAPHRANLADLLDTLGRRKDAIEQLQIALEQEPTYAYAHSILASLLESGDPEKALHHCEQAVRFALHDDDLKFYLPKLADLQEKLGRFTGAIRTLREMIALDPTSSQVNNWKTRIARLRQSLDEEERKRSARQRLQEQGELPLPTLVFEWLRAAGLTVRNPSASWLLAEGGRGLPAKLPVTLISDPVVTATRLRAIARAARPAKQIVVVAAAETLAPEALHQLAALQDECSVALTTALEVRDALLRSDRECRVLLDRALQQAGRVDNAFQHTGVVQIQAEFFGRVAELEQLTSLLGRGQQVGLFGIHKIGKSSLLEQLRRKLHLSNPEITVVQIELEAGLKEAGEFYRRVLERLPGLIELAPGQTVSLATFRSALTEFHRQRMKERPNHRLLLALDEYAYLIPDRRGQGGLQGFIEVLGSLKAMHQEGWLLVLPCGRTAALNRQASWGREENPFVGLFHANFLGPLTRAENDALMITLGARSRLDFAKDALAIVYEETGGHPLFSRLLGSQILRDGHGRVTPRRVRQAVESFLQDNDQCAIPKAIYEERLDDDEQEIARKLALEGPQPTNVFFPAEADVERRRQIRDSINNLVDTTVLAKLKDGRVAHRYGLMRRVIEQEMRDLGFE